MAGITAEELARFRRPVSYAQPSEPVPQPTMDPTKPWLRGYPEAAWRRILATPDAVVTAQASEPTPPVAVEG